MMTVLGTLKMRDWKMRDRNVRVENAGLENAGNARMENAGAVMEYGKLFAKTCVSAIISPCKCVKSFFHGLNYTALKRNFN